MNTQMLVDVAVPAAAVLGEGPVWDVTERRLLWVDIEGRMLHRYDPVSRVDQSVATSARVGAVAVRQAGGLVLAMEHTFALTAARRRRPHGHRDRRAVGPHSHERRQL